MSHYGYWRRPFNISISASFMVEYCLGFRVVLSGILMNISSIVSTMEMYDKYSSTLMGFLW